METAHFNKQGSRQTDRTMRTENPDPHQFLADQRELEEEATGQFGLKNRDRHDIDDVKV